jgi:hypothetical protein
MHKDAMGAHVDAMFDSSKARLYGDPSLRA